MNSTGNVNINDSGYWDQVYLSERSSGKRRIDNDRLEYVVGEAKDNWQYHPQDERPLLLDVGCGDGEFLRFFHGYLPTWEKYGIDITPKTIDLAQKDSPSFKLGVNSVYEIPYENMFDVVFMGETLEHLEAPEEAIKQCFKACKPGGYVIISTPNEHANYSPEHINEFTVGDCISLTSKYGLVKFETIRVVCGGISIIWTTKKS